ncbi:hypothetical protein AWB94_22995 [Mycolicibacterium canariasense]|nr:hypothetical protein AWB94_22995 [Mycolicibacterium canariasense]
MPARRRGRRILWPGLLILAAVIGFGCWLGLRALDAKAGLEQARQSAQLAKDALVDGKTQEAVQWADATTEHARNASSATHSMPWQMMAAIPWIGSPFKSGQQISDAVLALATDVLQPSARMGTDIAPDRLLDDGRIDVQLLRSAEPQLAEIAANAGRLEAETQAIADPGYVPMLRDARAKLQEQTADITTTLHNTALAAQLVPSMMGADGPRTYFMGFQTNAEARGTGGLLGGFGILRLDNGAAKVDTLAANTELSGSSALVDLGPEYAQQYGFTNPFTDFRNSNLSAHFPYAAQIWKAMWAHDSGMNVDGVIALDPVALSYVLGAVGPVTMPDGEVITEANVIELTESTAYQRFPNDPVARKKYLQDIAGEVVEKMTGPVPAPRQLLDALGRAVGERRIAVWSATPAEQELLEKTSLAHIIPEDAAPYAGVVINNLGGNKLDYYLRREIEYTADGCDGQTRKSAVSIRLSSTAPGDSLPDYVAGAAGLLPNLPIDIPRATMVTSVRLITTTDAKLVSVTANGQRIPAVKRTERGHPSLEVQVIIPPGQSGDLVFHLSEPTAAGSARVPVQPLLDNVVPTVSVPDCSG